MTFAKITIMLLVSDLVAFPDINYMLFLGKYV